MGFSSDGSLYYGDLTGRYGVYVAEVDPATWKMKNAPKEISNAVRDGVLFEPAWSPDGKFLAFVWRRPRTDDVKVVLHSFDAAPDRELSTHVYQLNLHGWSPDGKSLVIVDRDKGMRLFDTETQREQVILGPKPQIYLEGSVSDGRAVFYPTFDGGPLGLGQTPAQLMATDTIRLMRHDLQTGEERELYHAEAWRRGPLGPAVVVLSPDGRSLVLGFLRPDGQEKHLLLPVSGGGPREIPSAHYESWTQDSKALLFVKSDEIWVQPVDGSAAYGTGVRFNGIGSASVHPDGSRIAFTASTSNQQVWTIKNLFSETSVAK
jgi:Tol biopolymer transport system component